MFFSLRAILLVSITVAALAIMLGVIGSLAWVRLVQDSQRQITPATTISADEVPPPTRPAASVEQTQPAPATRPALAAQTTPALISLAALDARLHGSTIRKDKLVRVIHAWTSPTDWADWPISPQSGPAHDYFVDVTYSMFASKPQPFVVVIGDNRIAGQIVATGSWAKFKTIRVGPIPIAPGDKSMSIRRADDLGGQFMRLRHVDLVPVGIEEPMDPIR